LLDEEIIKRAKMEAELIINEAKEKERRTLEEIKERLKKENEEKLKRFEEEHNEYFNEKISEERLKLKRALEEKKAALFEERLREAISLFLRTDRYKRYLISSIEKIKQELGDEFKLIINKDDKELIKEIIEKYENFKGLKITIEEGLNDKGVYAISADGKYGFDCRFSNFIEQKKDELMKVFYMHNGWL
jgi:vacuolar-type H+-ATPase subunit E/Vma4